MRRVEKSPHLERCSPKLYISYALPMKRWCLELHDDPPNLAIRTRRVKKSPNLESCGEMSPKLLSCLVLLILWWCLELCQDPITWQFARDVSRKIHIWRTVEISPPNCIVLRFCSIVMMSGAPQGPNNLPIRSRLVKKRPNLESCRDLYAKPDMC